MSKRNYPLVLIDRTKDKAHPHYFITVTDREVGFVARVIEFNNNKAIADFIERQSSIENGDVAALAHYFKAKEGGLILHIEDFFYYMEFTEKQKTRIKSLLKRAMKKFLHGESQRSPEGEAFSIDNQIKMQEQTVEVNKANYEALVQRAGGDRSLADYQIALAEAILETLKSQRTINLN